MQADVKDNALTFSKLRAYANDLVYTMEAHKEPSRTLRQTLSPNEIGFNYACLRDNWDRVAQVLSAYFPKLDPTDVLVGLNQFVEALLVVTTKIETLNEVLQAEPCIGRLQAVKIVTVDDLAMRESEAVVKYSYIMRLEDFGLVLLASLFAHEFMTIDTVDHASVIVYKLRDCLGVKFKHALWS